MCKLLTFGIIKESLSMTEDGNVDLANHRKMLESIKYREGRREESEAGRRSEDDAVGDVDAGDIILVPGPLDILMGRGRHPHSLPGALRLHNVILQHGEAYNAASRCEKTVLTGVVLAQIKELGCRFLKVFEGGYEVCDDAVASSKISHGFRNARLRRRAKAEGGQKRPIKRTLES
jgi:hypothetical protein